jgi:hypothetical protein
LRMWMDERGISKNDLQCYREEVSECAYPHLYRLWCGIGQRS